MGEDGRDIDTKGGNYSENIRGDYIQGNKENTTSQNHIQVDIDNTKKETKDNTLAVLGVVLFAFFIVFALIFFDSNNEDKFHGTAPDSNSEPTDVLQNTDPSPAVSPAPEPLTSEPPTPEPPPSGNGEPISTPEINYAQLEKVLQAGQWKEASDETYNIMVQVLGSERNLRNSELLENFPCPELKQIDDLWVKYSNGHFGYSVQKSIYSEIAGQTFNPQAWNRFVKDTGWMVEIEGQWKWRWRYDTQGHPGLIYDLQKAPKGHLPPLWYSEPKRHALLLRLLSCDNI